MKKGLDRVFGSGILFIVLMLFGGHLQDALQEPGGHPASARMHWGYSCAGGANMSTDNLIINAEPDGSVRVTVTAESGPRHLDDGLDRRGLADVLPARLANRPVVHAGPP